MAGSPRLGKHTATGNLVEDPVSRDVKGNKLVTFRLADTPRVFDRAANEWKDGETVFYDVAVKNARFGENIMASLSRGNRVTVAGNYEPVPYVAKDGSPGLNHRLWADDVSASLEFATVRIEPTRATANVSPSQSVQEAGVDVPVSAAQAEVDARWGLTPA